MDFFNECIVMLIIYHLICFSDFLTRAESRTNMGYSVIFWTLVVFVVNFVLVFNVIIRQSIKSSKLKLAKMREDRDKKAILDRRRAAATLQRQQEIEEFRQGNLLVHGVNKVTE